MIIDKRKKKERDTQREKHFPSRSKNTSTRSTRFCPFLLLPHHLSLSTISLIYDSLPLSANDSSIPRGCSQNDRSTPSPHPWLLYGRGVGRKMRREGRDIQFDTVLYLDRKTHHACRSSILGSYPTMAAHRGKFTLRNFYARTSSFSPPCEIDTIFRLSIAWRGGGG